MLLGVDVGGTFTDAVLYDGRALHSAKAPTTPHDQSVGVLAATAAALERAGCEASMVSSFAHGMTVGTNALLTGAGARTALIATRGFTDLLDVGRQNRPHLYRLCAPKAAPLVAEGLRFGAAERVGPRGVVEPLGASELNRLVEELRGSDAEAVAICLLFSYRHPAHEQAIAERLRAELPGLHVSASHEVPPMSMPSAHPSPDSLASNPAPTAPPAGPERTLQAPARAASLAGATPPDDIITVGSGSPRSFAASPSRPR